MNLSTINPTNKGATIALIVLACFLAGIIFIVDINTELGYAIGAMYCVVILYSWLLPGDMTPIHSAIIGSVLITLGAIFSTDSNPDSLQPEVNRIISLIVIWVCAALVAITKRSLKELEKTHSSLELKVSERTKMLRESQSKLKESEELYRYLYENAHEMYVSVDPSTTKVLKCNHTLCNKLGYTKAEIIGKSVFDLYHEDCGVEVVAAFNQFKKIGSIENKELILKTKFGEKIEVMLNVSGVYDIAGKLQYSRSSWTDVSAIKKAENQFKQLLESAPDAMVIVNQKGEIQLANEQVQNIFGYTKEELINQPIEILIPDRFKGNHHHHRKGFFDKPKMRPMGAGLELKGKRKSGEEFSVEISLSPLETASGVLVTAAIRDITSRKLAEEELKAYNQQLQIKNKELEQFAYVASHDLQEPLRTVSSFTSLLIKDYGQHFDATGKKSMGFIIEATNRMSNLIQGLLDYSRIGRKREISKIDMNLIVSEIQEDLISSIEETGAKIKIEKLPVVAVYETEFRLLVQNLISNAIKFRKKDTAPKIEISAENKGRFWQFSIKDNGIGIKENHLDRIFVIFQRLHTRREFEGTGIGLAHCQKIAELHGGRIWVESKLGEGSTFFFTIPI